MASQMIQIKYKNIGSHILHLRVVRSFGVNSNTVQLDMEINLILVWDFHSQLVNPIILIMAGTFSMPIQIVSIKNGMIHMISGKTL